MHYKIFLLTGEVQSGKTTLLQSFCSKYCHTGGILTPVVNGKRVFYNIRTKEVFNMEAGDEEEQLCVGKYIFSAAAFKKAANQLSVAGKQNDNDYLVVDEIGPLEIQMKQGFYDPLLELIEPQINKTVILVVRPSLIMPMKLLPCLKKAVVFSLADFKIYFGL